MTPSFAAAVGVVQLTMLRQGGPGLLDHNFIFYIISTVVSVVTEQHELVVDSRCSSVGVIGRYSTQSTSQKFFLCQTVQLHTIHGYALAVHKVTTMTTI